MLAPEYLEYFGDGIFTRLFDTGTGFEIKMNTKGEIFRVDEIPFYPVFQAEERKGKERKVVSSRSSSASRLIT